MAAGDRILSLDGGGIRGLIMLEILDAIEKEAGKPIKDLFDWIGGTSTGGIVALGIATDKTLDTIKGIYNNMKGKVFKGKTPYDSAQIKEQCKQNFGTSVMGDIKHPKILVTGVLGDHSPWKLHMFRSYTDGYEPEAEGFWSTQPPKKQLIWEVARSTSAAPIFFHPYRQYFDGGLLSNNPTLDILTEIHKFNTGPTSQVTETNGPPTDRARAWCGMMDVPFFRLTPLLSDNVPMDCVDDEKITKMLNETHTYIRENKATIKRVAELLTKK